MPEFSHPLGVAIREARVKKGVSQNQVADMLDIDTRTVLNIENDNGNPKMEVLYPLIRLLQVDANRVFYPETVSPNPAMNRFQAFLATCSEDELDSLLPICEIIINSFRPKK